MKRIINTGSIRFRFFVFIALLLLVLLLLLNLYPYISARDAVYQEKQSSMSSRGAALASALAVLDRPTGGTVRLDCVDTAALPEKDVAAFRRDQLGFVFQEFNLLDTFTIISIR